MNEKVNLINDYKALNNYLRPLAKTKTQSFKNAPLSKQEVERAAREGNFFILKKH